MIDPDVASLIRQLRVDGSDNRLVEAKSAAGGLPKSLAASLCAFANLPGGGVVILGLDEAKGFSVVRLKNATELAQGVVSVARQSLVPPVHVDVQLVAFEGKTIVVAVVAEAPPSAKPVRLGSGRAYLRFGDGDYQLSAVEEEAFVIGRTRPNFDQSRVAEAHLDDLDDELVAKFREQARTGDLRLRTFDDEQVLVKTGVVKRSGTPTLAGLLALGEYPQQFVPSFAIRAALLPAGTYRGQLRALDEATFTGPVSTMLDDTVEWVKRNSRNEIVEDDATGRVRNQLWPPTLAVRELVANAIVHRDFAPWSGGRAIELRMTADIFRITSPGGLYGVTVSALGTLELTSARNRTLVDICKRLHTADGRVVEALATGIPTVFEELAAAGLPAPRFFDDGLSFTAIIDSRLGVRLTSDARRTTSPPASPRATPALEEVLRVLEDGPSDQATIAARLGIQRASVAKRLQKLKATGLIVTDGGRGMFTLYRLAADPAPKAPREHPIGNKRV